MHIIIEAKKAIGLKHKGHHYFPIVPRNIFGSGSFSQLGDILLSKRGYANAPFIFLVDDVFKGTELAARIPIISNDRIIFISADVEPKTGQIDALIQKIQKEYSELPCGIVGIGGGTLLDVTKAVSIMLTNEGSSADYQGWDLVQKPAIYHIGIPTISGTGAEFSRTAVLLGPEKKIGINSKYTTFDQVILDPNLTSGVSKDQWFYSGMNCFIQCIESLNGIYLNSFRESYSEMALDLCKEVYLGELTTEDSRDKLMLASWYGGMSIAYSQVGVAHAISYGLGYLLGVKHGIGNCLVFQHLEEFYPEGVKLFNQMKEKQGIFMPEGICAALSNEDFDIMIKVALGMEALWENALGKGWRNFIDQEKLRSIYEKI